MMRNNLNRIIIKNITNIQNKGYKIFIGNLPIKIDKATLKEFIIQETDKDVFEIEDFEDVNEKYKNCIIKINQEDNALPMYNDLMKKVINFDNEHQMIQAKLIDDIQSDEVYQNLTKNLQVVKDIHPLTYPKHFHELIGDEISNIDDILVPINTRGFNLGKAYILIKDHLDIEFFDNYSVINSRKFVAKKADLDEVNLQVKFKYDLNLKTKNDVITKSKFDLNDLNKQYKIPISHYQLDKKDILNEKNLSDHNKILTFQLARELLMLFNSIPKQQDKNSFKVMSQNNFMNEQEIMQGWPEFMSKFKSFENIELPRILVHNENKDIIFPIQFFIAARDDQILGQINKIHKDVQSQCNNYSKNYDNTVITPIFIGQNTSTGLFLKNTKDSFIEMGILDDYQHRIQTNLGKISGLLKIIKQNTNGRFSGQPKMENLGKFDTFLRKRKQLNNLDEDIINGQKQWYEQTVNEYQMNFDTMLNNWKRHLQQILQCNDSEIRQSDYRNNSKTITSVLNDEILKKRL